jgi:hypothetical protein
MVPHGQPQLGEGRVCVAVVPVVVDIAALEMQLEKLVENGIEIARDCF